MAKLSKICYTEDEKKELLKKGKEEKDFHIFLEEIYDELYAVKGEVELRKRIQIHALINNDCMTALYNEINAKINADKELIDYKEFKDAWDKWFLGINRFPEDIKHLLLEHYGLEEKLTLKEKVVYFRTIEEYEKPLSNGKGRLSNKEKENRRMRIEKHRSAFEIESNESLEEVESSYYLEEIKEKFILSSKKEKYMLANYFHAYTAIPFQAFVFGFTYANLDDVRKVILRKAMEKVVCEMGEILLRAEELYDMEEMLTINTHSLQDYIENSDECVLAKIFHEKINVTTFSEDLFYDFMEVYPYIEADEWKMIIDFVKLGKLYNPDRQNFSDFQKKIDSFIELLM